MPSSRQLPSAVLALLIAGTTFALPAEAQKAATPRPGPSDSTAMSLVFPGGDTLAVGRYEEPRDEDQRAPGATTRAPTPGWTLILSEDAEGNFPSDNGWTVYDSNATSGSDYWDDVGCRTFAGSGSIWSAAIGDQTDCVQYDNDMTSWMIFGPFSLADAAAARAEFRVWSETERPDIPYDYFFWGASTDGTNYNGFGLTANTDWALQELDFEAVPTLGDLTGEANVWFGLAFVSDFSINSDEGTYVDDILIEKLVPNPDDPPGELTLSNDPPVCDTGAPGPSPAVLLRWTPALGATSYDLYRDGSLYASGITGTTFYNSANLSAGSSYSYVTRAENSNGTTDSNTVTVAIPSDICQGDIRVDPLTLTYDRPQSSPVRVASAPAPSSVDAYEEFFARQTRQVDYRGLIVDRDGMPLEGRRQVQVSYFGSDATAAFVETFERVEIDGGRMDLTLGTGQVSAEGRYDSLEQFFADHPQATMELTVSGQPYAPRVGLLPAGHSLAAQLGAAAEGVAKDWEGFESRTGATAVQAALLSPRQGNAAAAGRENPEARRHPFSLPVVGPMTSRPVAALPPIPKAAGKSEVEVNPPRHGIVADEDGQRFGTTTAKVEDPLRGRRNPTVSSPTVDFTFEGISNVLGYIPPDIEAAVGPAHYVQVVNSVFSIYDKVGNLLTGPALTNSLWDGFGGPCETDNSGDAIFLYDNQADRFVLSQFAVAGNHQSVCFAVSQTSDPTGSYFLYEVVTPRFPDYYKVGVWPANGNDAYFFGTNSGVKGQYDVFAIDRANMLAGAAARPVQFFQSFDNLMMPADVDGLVGPSSGQPGLFYTIRDGGEPYFDSPPTDSLDLWEFDVDWTTPANSTFTLVRSFTPAGGLAEFNWTVCGFFVSPCLPQPGTTRKIDSASWWPMQRFVFRNFGSHQALVGTWTVNATDSGIRAAPRWFELRDTGGGWSLYQQGTQSPDAVHRWMASIAMDGAGNIALGYNLGDSSTYPSIAYATRAADDPLGTLQAEASLYAGSGSQTSTSARWGDYSSMELDPADDCTFWYTTEYLAVTSNGSWKTRVGTFSVPGCKSQTAGSQSFQIYNDGTGPLEVTSLALETSAPWISWTPQAPLTLASGTSQQVVVSVDFEQAPVGSSSSRLLVSSDDSAESPYPGGVQIVVGEGPAPPTIDLVLSDETVTDPGPYEACGSLTLGPNLVIGPSAQQVVFRAPEIVFVPSVRVVSGTDVVFDTSGPAGCN